MISITTASWIGLAFLMFHIYMIFHEKNKGFRMGLAMGIIKAEENTESKKKYAIKYIHFVYKGGSSTTGTLYEERVCIILVELSNSELTNQKLLSIINTSESPNPTPYVIDIQRIA